jgi:hypothetical protein
MRWALLFTAFFGQLVAPWLCCCTLQASTQSVCPVQHSAAAVTPSVEPCSHCCSHKPVPKLETADSISKQKQTPSCPCSITARVQQPVTIPDRQTVPEADFSVELEAWLPAYEFSQALDAIRPYIAQRIEPLFTTEIKLFSHHVLRC